MSFSPSTFKTLVILTPLQAAAVLLKGSLKSAKEQLKLGTGRAHTHTHAQAWSSVWTSVFTLTLGNSLISVESDFYAD